MRAILLAAGRGRRLGRNSPKCLLELEGKTLLERHFENMEHAGITALTIVVGFEQEQIKSRVAGLTPGFPVDFVENPRFVHGSILSLHVASPFLSSGAIWMDADVLYPSQLLKRLVESRHENAVLIDTRSDETGEEMMVGIRSGRAIKVARRVGADFDAVGESVGFTKVGPAGAAVMTQALTTLINAGKIDEEYEAAMNIAFEQIPFGFERADDFDWTEIDFEEDVQKANGLLHKAR